MPESQSNNKKSNKKMVELLVMLKDGHAQTDVAQLSESVQAQVVEVKMMFNKIVGLISLEASASETALIALQQDSRVELAQVNRTYKHC